MRVHLVGVVRGMVDVTRHEKAFRTTTASTHQYQPPFPTVPKSNPPPPSTQKTLPFHPSRTSTRPRTHNNGQPGTRNAETADGRMRSGGLRCSARGRGVTLAWWWRVWWFVWAVRASGA